MQDWVFRLGCAQNKTSQKVSKKCSTGQRFICTEVTSYKIHILNNKHCTYFVNWYFVAIFGNQAAIGFLQIQIRAHVIIQTQWIAILQITTHFEEEILSEQSLQVSGLVLNFVKKIVIFVLIFFYGTFYLDSRNLLPAKTDQTLLWPRSFHKKYLEYRKVEGRSTSSLVTCLDLWHPQRLDFLYINMSRLVVPHVTNLI